MNPQIVLRDVAAAAADFVDLAMGLGFAGDAGYASDARADAAAVGLGADGPHFNPVVGEFGVATKKLREVVYRVDDNVDVAVVVEVAEGAAAACGRIGDSRTNLERNIREVAVAEVAIEQLALTVSGFGFQLLDFGIDVAVADQNVGPAVVVVIEEAAAPAQKLGVRS